MLLEHPRVEPARPLPPTTVVRGQRPLITALNALAQGRAKWISHSERNWASATFAGARHTITLAFNDVDGVAAGEDFIAMLPEHEFDIPGQLVADAAVTAVDHQLMPGPSLTVTAELLLLQDS